jgi:hypothetical protein
LGGGGSVRLSDRPVAGQGRACQCVYSGASRASSPANIGILLHITPTGKIERKNAIWMVILGPYLLEYGMT